MIELTLPIYPDLWLDHLSAGPLHADAALEADKVRHSPLYSRPEREQAEMDYADAESLQGKLSDAYAGVLVEAAGAVCAAFSLQPTFLVWTVDADEPDGIEKIAVLPDWPDGPTWQETVTVWIRSAVTVQKHSPWGVSLFGELRFEL